MVNSLENIDKSKVYVDRIEGLDEVVAGTIYTTLTGAVSSITFSDLQPNKILVSDNIGKVSNSSKGIDDLPDGKTITVSQSNNYQTVGIINQNTSYSEVLKSWSGTKAEYDALKAQPSYYAWVDNYEALYFTRSLTPSVGDTVYFGANKEDTGYFKVYSFNNGNLVVENVGTSYFPVTRDSSQDEIGQVSQIDSNTLYNITDDTQASTYEAYSKSETNTLLAAKADDNNVVHKTGAETINGQKTFNESLIQNMDDNEENYQLILPWESGNNLSDQKYPKLNIIKDTNGISLAFTQYTIFNWSQSLFNLHCNNFVDTSQSVLFDMSISANGSGYVEVNKYFRPKVDNTLTLGDANLRWKQLYAGTATINTSDERVKQQIESIPSEVLDAWGEVNFYQYKFNNSVKEKGDKARYHTGLIAQRIENIFKAHNLNAFDYGLLCYDEWDAEEEQRDDKGNIILEGREAGSRYSLRYEECLCMEAAYQRRRADRMEARLTTLEEKIKEIK